MIRGEKIKKFVDVQQLFLLRKKGIIDFDKEVILNAVQTLLKSEVNTITEFKIYALMYRADLMTLDEVIDKYRNCPNNSARKICKPIILSKAHGINSIFKDLVNSDVASLTSAIRKLDSDEIKKFDKSLINKAIVEIYLRWSIRWCTDKKYNNCNSVEYTDKDVSFKHDDVKGVLLFHLPKKGYFYINLYSVHRNIIEVLKQNPVARNLETNSEELKFVANFISSMY